MQQAEKATDTGQPHNGCRNFKRHILSHYAGNNSLHPDADKAHQLYQTSVMSALMQGVYEGEVTYEELAKHGDFGLGTFNDLDGEMVAIDGQFYQLRSDGTASPVDPKQKTPFATVNFFLDGLTKQVHHPLGPEALKIMLDELVKTGNLFFAIRVDGLFSRVHTRTVSIQQKPFKKLTAVTAAQTTFNFENIRGTLAGYRSPDYAQGLTVAGYHLHFISEDRKGGGHVLDFVLDAGTIRIDPYSSIFVALPETPEFEQARLGNDSDDIKKAEGQ